MAEPTPKRKEIYTYTAPWLIYGMNWSVRADQRFRPAVGSFEEEQLVHNPGKRRGVGSYMREAPVRSSLVRAASSASSPSRQRHGTHHGRAGASSQPFAPSAA